MSNDYQLDIELDESARCWLDRAGLRLIVAKTIRTNSPVSVPVIWHTRAPDGSLTRLRWSDRYQIWLGRGRSDDTPCIDPLTVMDAEPGDRFALCAPAMGHLTHDGGPGTFELFNPTGHESHGGIAQVIDGAMSPICTAPIRPGNLVEIEPVDSVLVMFAEQEWAIGRRLVHAPADGLLVTLPTPHARISWSIRTGWITDTAAALPVSAGACLRGLLAGPPLVQQALERDRVLIPFPSRRARRPAP